jgi:hypothetical protein
MIRELPENTPEYQQVDPMSPAIQAELQSRYVNSRPKDLSYDEQQEVATKGVDSGKDMLFGSQAIGKKMGKIKQDQKDHDANASVFQSLIANGGVTLHQHPNGDLGHKKTPLYGSIINELTRAKNRKDVSTQFAGTNLGSVSTGGRSPIIPRRGDQPRRARTIPSVMETADAQGQPVVTPLQNVPQDPTAGVIFKDQWEDWMAKSVERGSKEQARQAGMARIPLPAAGSTSPEAAAAGMDVAPGKTPTGNLAISGSRYSGSPSDVVKFDDKGFEPNVGPVEGSTTPDNYAPQAGRVPGVTGAVPEAERDALPRAYSARTGDGNMTPSVRGVNFKAVRTRSGARAERRKTPANLTQATVRKSVNERIAAEQNFAASKANERSVINFEAANTKRDNAVSNANLSEITYESHPKFGNFALEKTIDESGNVTHHVIAHEPPADPNAAIRGTLTPDAPAERGMVEPIDIVESIGEYSTAIGEIQAHMSENYSTPSTDPKTGAVTNTPLNIPKAHIIDYFYKTGAAKKFDNDYARYTNRSAGDQSATVVNAALGLRGVIEQHRASMQDVNYPEIRNAAGEVTKPAEVRSKTKRVLSQPRMIPVTSDDGKTPMFRPCNNPDCATTKSRKKGRQSEVDFNKVCPQCTQPKAPAMQPDPSGAMERVHEHVRDGNRALAPGQRNAVSDYIDNLAKHSLALTQARVKNSSRGIRKDNNATSTQDILSAARVGSDPSSVIHENGLRGDGSYVPTPTNPMGHKFVTTTAGPAHAPRCGQCESDRKLRKTAAGAGNPAATNTPTVANAGTTAAAPVSGLGQELAANYPGQLAAPVRPESNVPEPPKPAPGSTSGGKVVKSGVNPGRASSKSLEARRLKNIVASGVRPPVEPTEEPRA